MFLASSLDILNTPKKRGSSHPEKTEGEELGTGTGQIRTYLLAHIAKAGTMDLRVDDIVLPASAWLLAEDGKSVRVSAAKKAVITADYDWISETPIVYQFVSLFAE